ncbi:formimidoylglutamate deiminase [Ramlibacter albus]|uniref:Formimidoylglutamate deiminase n=1 Tax=Ramlibacter albus TaxID=2079448 RepID=A0A923S332_9BURK|nr:formimidoylglutamate deiminase [Ramlibacter albus]MBC5766114.1 formimidoylglutamate deiminase [Ramlibacter albus]
MGGERRYLAPAAWVNGAWAKDVLLEVGADGRWARIEPGAPSSEAERVPGPILPGLVNAHSHAFQRAIAGLTERSSGTADNFWHWRDRMYAAALRISPQQVEAIAAYLYAELLRAGYTHVCEFHYLHNDLDGKPYADAAEMSHALVRAAQRVGIGITVLPTLYMRSGFAAKGLRDDQRRFASTPESVLRIGEAVRRASNDADRVTAGVALHSLRAVDEAAVGDVARAAAGPVHIHIAEQQQEVADCLERHGQRPVEWLLAHATPDARWNLVHATQTTRDELAALRSTGASIVLCPSTEGNLGDGVFDLPAWMGASGRWSIGSDSHVTRSWQEELRLLEYSQRFVLRQRNVAAHAAVATSTAAALFDGAVEGGTAAAGVPLAGLAVGQRADFVVVDTESPALVGLPEDHLLDAIVFSSPDARFSRVYVAGEEVKQPELREAFGEAMQALWA